MNWLVAVGTITVGVVAGTLLVVALKRQQQRSSFSVGDRVRVVGHNLVSSPMGNLVAGRVGTIEDGGRNWTLGRGAWMVRFDGDPAAVTVLEQDLQHDC